MVFEDIDDLNRDEGELFGEIVNIFGEEDEEFGKPLIFLLDVAKELIKLLLIHLGVFGDVVGVEGRVGGDLHVELFKLFEQSIVDFFDLFFLHC